MAFQQWLQQAAGYFENDALANHPFYDIVAPLKGYDVIHEEAGIGLIINNDHQRRDFISVANLLFWSHSDKSVPDVVSVFCMRTMHLSEWQRTEDLWIENTKRIIELRKRGYKICNTHLVNKDEFAHTVSVSIFHPFSHQELARFPFFLSLGFQKLDGFLKKQLRTLMGIDDFIPYEPSENYKTILQAAREKSSQSGLLPND